MEEFIHYKTEDRYHHKWMDFFQSDMEKAREFLWEYLNFGGYPRVVLETEREEKRRIIDEIYRSLLERDLAYLLKVEKVEAFSQLVKVLADQVGKLVNYSELSSAVGLSAPTLKDYLWYSQKIYILKKNAPYFRNIRKEITKAPVMYFSDLGLRNYSIGLFGHITESAQAGFLFQNLIYNILNEKFYFSGADIRFWRTKDKAEVDFVVDLKNRVIPVEVKFKDLKRPEIESSLRSFIAQYHPPEAWIINLALNQKQKVNGTNVHFIPWYELMNPAFSPVVS